MKRLFLLFAILLCCVGNSIVFAQHLTAPRISGYVLSRYQFDRSDNANQFDIRNANITLSGSLAKGLDYNIQAGFAGSVRLVDAYAKYGFVPQFVLQAGQNKVPFMLETPMSPYAIETVESSMAVKQYLNPSGRDIGITVSGAFIPKDGYNLIEYAAGVYNGSGINVSDDNTKKDLSARINVNPLKYLTASFSVYSGVGTQHNPTGVDYDYDKQIYSVGLRFNNNLVNVRSEYAEASVDNIDSNAFYILGQYWFMSKFAPTLRYDHFGYDVSSLPDMDTFTLGFNYKPVSNLTLIANYIRKQVAGSADKDVFAIQFNLNF